MVIIIRSCQSEWTVVIWVLTFRHDCFLTRLLSGFYDDIQFENSQVGIFQLNEFNCGLLCSKILFFRLDRWGFLNIVIFIGVDSSRILVLR